MTKYPLTYNEFKEALKEDKLLGLACLECGQFTVPPNAVCTSCGASTMEVKPLSKKGKIRTFTVVRVGPEGYTPPYIVALVELQEGPWVLGNIVGLDPLQAEMSLIDRDVLVGSKILPFESPQAGIEGVALTFELA